MANMDITQYILKRLENVNNSQLSSDFFTANATSAESSIFNDISFANLENFDYSSAINALSSGTFDQSQIAGDDISAIFQAFMTNEQIQSLADSDGVDGISEEEAKELLQNIAGFDGDISSLTQSDIDAFIDSLGGGTEEDILAAIQEAFDNIAKEVEANRDDILAGMMEADAASNVAANQNVSSPYSGSNSNYNNNYSSNYSGNTPQTPTKTAAEELEELREQRNDIITTADENIAKKQDEKDKLVANDSKLSQELKTEYANQQKILSDYQSKLSDAQESLAKHSSSLADIDADIAALEGEQSTIKTDTDDSKINKENKARLSEIADAIDTKKAKKKELEGKITKDQDKIDTLTGQEAEQQKVVDAVELKIGEANPSLKKDMDALTKDIEKLKSQKTKDVQDIDDKIAIKEKEQKKEAKEAGENKGKAANDIGSGLVALASKYMGKNEADGSYKMFTNGRTEAWCADFVTYVVKEYAKENGMSVAEGFGSPAVQNLMDWAKNNGVFDNTSQMSDKDKLNYLRNNLSVGDVIIWKSNGASHTGIVQSINPDGTFTTVEGNSGDQVKSNKKSIYDKSLTGFIKLTDILT